MTNREPDHFRLLLEARLAALKSDDAAGSDARQTVALDQQSVGRLSRMDAMQQQAMANATHRRRAAERAQIATALARIEDGSFGECTDCGEDIPTRRLELNPTATICVACASGQSSSLS